jgi:hypothetical protein
LNFDLNGRLFPATIGVVSLLIAVLIYGLWRIAQTHPSLRRPADHGGPANHRTCAAGRKRYLAGTGAISLQHDTGCAPARGCTCRSRVWSETVLPPMNVEAAA